MIKYEFKHGEPMEISEIQSSDDGEVFWAEAKPRGRRAEGEPEVLGLPPSSLQELKKLSRAKRFGIPIEHGRTALVDTALITRLYKSLGIDEENEKHYRFNAVHMRGTQNMSTEDVFKYFTSYTPFHIEWINDVSCNIVWSDHFSAAKALLNLSKEIKNLDKIRFNTNPFKKDLEGKTEELSSSDNDAVDAREIEGPIPPGYWRIGIPSRKSQAILLRLATRSDKKQRFAEKNSEYYKKYGNPHFGNIPGIVSSSLRNEVFNKNKKKPQNSNEYGEDKNVKKNPWGHLAEEWKKQDEVTDVKSRIWKGEPDVQQDLRLSIIKKQAEKMPEKQMESDSESPEFGNDDQVKGKLPKMKMYADEEEKTETNPRREMINLQVNVPHVEDLRLKIDRSRKRKQMLEQGYKPKRGKYWNKSTFTKSDDDYYNEEEENDNDDNGNDNDNDNDNVMDDSDDEPDSTWALENYSDLRESLDQGRRYRSSNDAGRAERSDAEDKDDIIDVVCNIDIHHRSPLQIEIENDDYMENDSL